MVTKNTTYASDTSFRLGAASFVYPGDWRFNVERLAGRVGDIELLFFEAAGMPTPQEFAHLASLASAGHSYTVHTPLSASLASTDEARRLRGIEEVVDVIQRTAGLDPHAWILHVYLGDSEGDTNPEGLSEADLVAWRARATRALAEIAARTGENQRLCVESLDYDYRLIAPVIEALDLGVAWDIGHDLRDGRTSEFMLTTLLPRLKVVQWHGTDPDDRDHRSLRFVPRADALAFLQALLDCNFDGVVTLEVFREADFEESLTIASELVAKITANARTRESRDA